MVGAGVVDAGVVGGADRACNFFSSSAVFVYRLVS